MALWKSIGRFYMCGAAAVLPMGAMLAMADGDDDRSDADASFREITVERINVVEPDGSLKMIISSSDRMHSGIIDGEVILEGRTRPPGMLFFDDRGDEMGGVTFGGDATRRVGGVTFDQINTDETVQYFTAHRYTEEGGFTSTTGMNITDRRPDQTIKDLLAGYETLQAIEDPAERNVVAGRLAAEGVFGFNRLFVGREAAGDAAVRLSDASGKERLRLVVGADGAARIEFLDDDGAVTKTITGGE